MSDLFGVCIVCFDCMISGYLGTGYLASIGSASVTGHRVYKYYFLHRWNGGGRPGL